MTERRLVVLGGSGFLGRSICKEAVQNGWSVSSVSRSGGQKVPLDQDWAKKVNWVGADATDTEAYRALLASADAVVHAIGILRENKNDPNQTFEHVNRDSALVPARLIAATYPNVSKFVFISVAPKSFPRFGVNARYLSCKQEVEEQLMHMDDKPQGIVMRPGLMYGENRMFSFGLASLAGISSFITRWYNPFNAFISAKPIPVTTMAKAIVQTINAPSKSIKDDRILEIPDIERLSNCAYPMPSNKE